MAKQETAYFAGGCFWCTEAVFSGLKGVIEVKPGYAGGTTENPSYEEVIGGNTGHAETAMIKYDPDIISYSQLLKIFFTSHDPTTLNHQGNDIGTQYRSVIFFNNDVQKVEAQKYIKYLEKERVFTRPIVTEIKYLNAFYMAEDYHQKYYKYHREQPYCQIVITPKLAKLRKEFKELFG